MENAQRTQQNEDAQKQGKPEGDGGGTISGKDGKRRRGAVVVRSAKSPVINRNRCRVYI